MENGMDLFADRTIRAANPEVDYIPFINQYGNVGYEVRYAHNPRPVYIYFNPSTDTDDGEPNVFVYIGTQNDPGQDEAQHWYGINTVLSPLEDEDEAVDPSLDDHGAPDSEGFGYE